MSEGNAQENPAESVPDLLPVSGPGPLLLAARERLNVSSQEVADELKLSTHVIEALEKDDYAGMPPTVFSRGYLRSYARLLDLDPEELLKLYPQLAQEPEPSTQVSAVPVWQRKEMVQIGAVVAAGLLVVVVLLSVLFGADEEATTGSSEAASGRPEGAAPAAVTDRTTGALRTPATRPEIPAVPTSENESTAESAEDVGEAEDVGGAEDVGEAEVVVRVDVEDELPRTPAPIRRPTETGVIPAPVAELPSPPPVREVATQPASNLLPIASGVRRITESGDDRLTLTFASDCWVEVRSPDGKRLYSDLNRAGRRLELVGDGPFRVLLGYAPGVELSFNDEAVPLAALTRNNVANLVLGQ